MRIMPLDIYQQEFKRVLRGIDPDEVEDFLERVADDYEQVLKENAALKEQLDSLKNQLVSSGKAGEESGSDTGSREEADDIIRQAKKEADSIIREARKEAENIIHKARDEESEIRSERPEMVQEAVRKAADQVLETARAKAKELMAEVKMEELEMRREISRLDKRR